MTIRRLSQRYGYIAALLILSLTVGYAIPLLHAHPDQRHWSDIKDTSGWAWVGAHSFSVQGGNVKARSEHQCGVLNETGKKISVVVGYDHKVTRNGPVVANDSVSRTVTVQDNQYLTTSDVPANYVRSTSTPAAPGHYTFQPYTNVTYKGNAHAKTGHKVIELNL